MADPPLSNVIFPPQRSCKELDKLNQYCNYFEIVEKSVLILYHFVTLNVIYANVFLMLHLKVIKDSYVGPTFRKYKPVPRLCGFGPKVQSVRWKMLARRFTRCTERVTVILFKAYCQSFYTCNLWVKYTQRAYNALRILYNNAQSAVRVATPLQCLWKV